MPRLKSAVYLAWKIVSALCTLWLCLSLAGDSFMNSLCDETGSFTLTSPDNAIKATVYTRDCGAMAATRTFVAFSHPSADGSKHGDRILILLADDCHVVHPIWTANREFTIAYPKTADVEFAVSKTRGTAIRLKPE